MRRFALIGYPLGHSFSKKYFTEKFETEHLDAVFENYPLETLETLPDLVKKEALSGLAVTIPHKKNIIPYLQVASEAVLEIHACNCISVVNGSLHGYNTDITGFERSFAPLLQPQHTKALILGTGGAAAAVKSVLTKLDIRFISVSRNAGQDELGYNDLDETKMNEYKIIINCTPTGTYPDTEAAPAIPYQWIKASHYLYDLIYNPAETLFLRKGKQAGAVTKNGYEMLVLQAEENWKIWNAIP